MKKVIEVKSIEACQQLAAAIAKQLRGGEVVELVSDIGGGKTTFTRALVKALHSKDEASSPTFTISNIYNTPDFTIYHYDFYRLQDPGIIQHELEEALEDTKHVIVIEWSDIVAHVLPENRLTITIKTTGETARQFEFTYPAQLAYLLEDA